MKKALFITDRFDEIYCKRLQHRVGGLVEIIAPPQKSDIFKRSPALLSEVEIIMSGWHGPRLDREFLEAAPKLEAFFYAGGCTRSLAVPEDWRREIVICSSIHANSIPVAEYTMAQIILCLKQVYQATNSYRQDLEKTYSTRNVAGAYGGKVGLVGLGNTSRILLQLLKHLDVQIMACDPGVSAEAMQRLNVKKLSLENIFTESDVVSLHVPATPATEGMITGKLIKSMKTGASLINTARGSIIREVELVEMLRARPDLFAVLDVTDPEPPQPESELWALPNVMLTPHVAGSQGIERYRVGLMMVEELERYLSNQPLQWRVKDTHCMEKEAVLQKV
jgi:phosphoglycerate dehydrogenase-like enzyme